MESGNNLSDPLEDFKASLIDENHYDAEKHSDRLLQRFLKARNGNVPRATQMFMDWREWYVKAGVENIVANFAFSEYPHVAQIYPKFIHGTDKLGRMVLYQQHHKLDATSLFTVTSLERLEKLEIREGEKLEHYRLPACIRKSGEQADKVVVVMDANGYPFSQFLRLQGLISQIANINSNYHPETLGLVLIINAPYTFSLLWNLIVAIVPAEVAAKCKILGTDYQQTLLDLMDADQMPAVYGGSCACSGGCENADKGPWNDGSVPGFPDSFWEGMRQRDLDAAAAVTLAAATDSARTSTTEQFRTSVAKMKRFSLTGRRESKSSTAGAPSQQTSVRLSYTKGESEEDVFVDAE
ncbi:CRAL-TRIO domain-containing protein [Chytriomyces sp. MP71]|nr:CRAL-TRIO domain-containing protein [Chytriomyces sp. MP71]